MIKTKILFFFGAICKPMSDTGPLDAFTDMHSVCGLRKPHYGPHASDPMHHAMKMGKH
jgi:hypothetical protein